MKLLVSIIKPQRKKFYFSLFLKTLGSFTDLILPFLIVIMIDDVIPDLRNNVRPISHLYLLGGVMIFIAALGLVLNILANRHAEKVASLVVYDLRNDLFEKITHLESNQIDEITRSSLISRMTSDTYNIYNATAALQRIGIRAPILLIGGITLTLFLDPFLTLIMVLALPFILVLVYVTTKKGAPLYKQSQEKADKVVRTIREYVSGVRVIRALGMEDKEIEKYDFHNKSLIEQELKAHKVMAKVNPIMSLIMNLGLVAVLFAGVYRFQANLTDEGVIIAFVTYFTIILNAMMSITRIFMMLTRASASGQRIEEVLNMEKTIIDGESDFDNNSENHVTFNNVSFSYRKEEKQLDNISFNLKKGQTLGVIGATGSGKTTIVNLLLRFYDVDEGEILLYDKPIKSLSSKDYRKNIGVVFQNDLIFADTIYENIRLFRSTVEDIDVENSIEIAQANFIYEKQDSIHHIALQKGANLSGGQKQRVLIARALANNPELLILDDASSALDYKTDQSLRKSINEKLPNTTKIIVAQRISSVKDADIILLIHDGKLVAKGNHDTLIKESSMYQEIAYYQMGAIKDE